MADYPDIRAAAERLAEKDRAAFRPLPPGMTPQEAMRGLDAEKEMRVPAIVGAKLPDLDTLLEDRKVNRQLEASPRVKQFLQDGINAGLAKDDISNLSLIEKAGNHVAKGGLRSASGVVMRLAARNMELADFAGMGRNEILDKLISPEDRKRLIQEGNSSGVGLYMRDAAEIARAVEGTTAEEFRAGAMSAVETAGGLEKTARGLKGFEWGEEFARKYAEPAIKQPTASGQAMELLKGFAADPVGGWVFLQGIVLESTPMLAGAAVTGAVTRSPAAAVAALGVGSGTAEYSGEVQQFLGSKGIDITTDEGRRMLLNSPEIMAEADRKGFLKGAVIGMMDAMSGAIAGRALSKSPVGNMFAQMIVQAALGGGGEFLGDVAAGNDPNAANVILEALAEFVSAPGEVAIFAGRKAFAKDASRAEKATNVRTTLEPVAEATANSKLRERSKERFKAFLGQTDWADVDLRVDAEELRTLFQAKDVGPETWGIDPVEYETALASGGMVSIPSESIAEIAGTADAEWLMANATLSDDAMSESEAARFNEEFRDELDRFAAEQDRLAEAERQSRASDVQVRDAIFEQLRAAGRTADVAQRESAVWQSFFRTMAERYGDDPLDLARQFGVRIQGPSDARSRIRGNLDIALNTLRRQKPARKAQGLVDFLIRKGGVRDRGGDVADMEGPGRLISETAGDARQAALFPMEGKGMSLDEAARLAAEEGFFPDQIGKEYLPERVATDLVPLLLDAIRRDIAGEPVVRLEDMPLPDDLAALFEEIDRAGLTLDMTNDEIVAALGFDEYAGEGTLFQTAPPVDSEAFKRWFGDSKVVDENGDPLVVYHGGRQGIDAFDPARVGENDRDFGGFFFTESEDEASGYAWQVSGTVTPVYLSLQNPMMLRADDGRMPAQFWYDQRGFFAEKMQEAGHDGAIILDEDARDDADLSGAMFIAREPTQIKSVNNRGTFDPNDPRILYQQQTPEQFLASEGEWRDQSVTVQDEDGNDVQVSAGLAADVLMERLEQARQILECVNAAG